eukprot:scaffold182462_cov46-Attheya_sp.AAC.2
MISSEQFPGGESFRIVGGDYDGHVAIFLILVGDFSVLVNVCRGEPGVHPVHELDTDDYLHPVILHPDVLIALNPRPPLIRWGRPAPSGPSCDTVVPTVGELSMVVPPVASELDDDGSTADTRGSSQIPQFPVMKIRWSAVPMAMAILLTLQPSSCVVQRRASTRFVAKFTRHKPSAQDPVTSDRQQPQQQQQCCY